ncbi:DMT family transporter [Nocardia sp. CNY236]|uniref:DMT family transporter n=1 Tax=Nocardia sp. CNY236 TaxID=1169152 RepID=UPI00041B1E1D|nr:DMT family transporter [Nocardia sp. CNY236]
MNAPDAPSRTVSPDQIMQSGYPYLLTTMVLFGSAYASSKVVVGEMPHQLAAALRFAGGAGVLALLLLIVGRNRTPISRAMAIRAGLVGLIGVFAYNVFFFWGLSLAPSLDGAIIIPVISPVLTTAFLVVTGRESTSLPRIVGLIIAVCGAALFFVGAGSAGGQLSGSRLAGDLIYLGSAVCWAVYTIVSKRVLVGVDPLRSAAYGTSVGAVVLLIVAAPHLPSTDWGAVTVAGWANLVYLAVGPTAVALLCYARGLSVVAPSTATIMMFAVPVSGAVCSALFLGESFTTGQLVGSLVTVAGALLAVTHGQLLPSRTRTRATKPVAGASPTAVERGASTRR